MQLGILIRQVWKFAVTGGAGLVANLLILTGLVELLGVPELYAAIVSTLLVLAGGFVLVDRWVFTDLSVTPDAGAVVKRSSAYYAVMLTGKLLNYGIYVVLLRMDVWYPLAWFLGSVTVFVGTFSANRLLWGRVFE